MLSICQFQEFPQWLLKEPKARKNNLMKSQQNLNEVLTNGFSSLWKIELVAAFKRIVFQEMNPTAFLPGSEKWISFEQECSAKHKWIQFCFYSMCHLWHMPLVQDQLIHFPGRKTWGLWRGRYLTIFKWSYVKFYYLHFERAENQIQFWRNWQTYVGNVAPHIRSKKPAER